MSILRSPSGPPALDAGPDFDRDRLARGRRPNGNAGVRDHEGDRRRFPVLLGPQGGGERTRAYTDGLLQTGSPTGRPTNAFDTAALIRLAYYHK